MSIDLRDHVAVLVGRNGAGKSAILEGFENISALAVGRSEILWYLDINRILESIPKILEVEILTPTNRRLQYKYELLLLPNSDDDLEDTVDDSTAENSEENPLSWHDCCQYLDESQEVLWTTRSGITTLTSDQNDKVITIFGQISALQRRKSLESGNRQLKFPEEMQWVYSVLSRIRLLGKTSVRQTPARHASILQVSRKSPHVQSLGQKKVDLLARKVWRMSQEELHELESIFQRIGLGSKIEIQKTPFSQGGKKRAEADDQEYLASVLLDDVNIGFLSDGTLRVLSLLLELISPRPSITTVIEEPETQIHPGLLEKLLNEIEAYTADENLIISTHSPQVVSWAKKPDKINMVYRQDGRTHVRKLKETEIESVFAYLNEEGSLGEWLYSGILDD